jgi:hypothetical protein
MESKLLQLSLEVWRISQQAYDTRFEVGQRPRRADFLRFKYNYVAAVFVYAVNAEDKPLNETVSGDYCA